MKAGIIGFGYMGNFHLKKFRQIGVEVTAAFDIDEEKRADAEDEGLKAYDKLEDFLAESDVDIVVIATPNDSHRNLAIACLDSGKNVLCEKPVTLNVAELEDILACAKKNNKLFTTHQNRRWDADYLVVKNIVDSGEIGAVTTIVSQTFGQRGVCFGWRGDPEKGGGMVYDWGIHLIDQLLMLFEGKKVIGVYSRLRSILTPAVDDYFEIELEFEDDIVAHVSIGTFALQPMPRWFVFCDKGTLKLDDFSGEKGGVTKIKDNIKKFKRVKADSKLGPSRTMAHLEREDIEEIHLPKVDSDPLAFHNNLVNSVLGKEELIVTSEQMIRDMKVIEAVFKSSNRKERLEVEI